MQTSPNPLASYALIERLKSLVDIDLNMNELSLSAKFFQAEITRAISKQPDVESYVSKLEARYDEVISTSNEMPTGVDMVQEIENFLRTQSNG